MKTKNTEKTPNPEWLMGGDPVAIEVQEAEGQTDFIASEQLPRICNSHRGANTAEIYHKMGIKVFTTSKGDDLFLGVKLPDGWKKEYTSHSMWSNLVDDKGRIRATIFYKAAFYDRDAFINFMPRYHTISEYNGEKIEKDYVKSIVIKDSATGVIVFATKNHTLRNEEVFRNEAEEWLKKNFPDHENVIAYW